MKTASITGSIIVTIALVFYTIGFFNAKRFKLVNGKVLFFYTAGVMLDITATVFMIIGSTKGMITLHGLIGYSSLTGMLIDTFLLWRHKIREGSETGIRSSIYKYSVGAYIWWITSYITGGLLVALSRMHPVVP